MKYLSIAIALLLSSVSCNSKPTLDLFNLPSEYEGRYLLNPDLVIEVLKVDNKLRILPSFWRTSRGIDSIGIDEYSFRKAIIRFERNHEGIISRLEITGHREIEGRANKLDDKGKEPVELLIDGDTDRAIAVLLAEKENLTDERITKLAFNALRNYPSRSEEWLQFANAFAEHFPESNDLFQIIGLASLQQKDRNGAKTAFEKAYQINAKDNLNATALRLLNSKLAPDAPVDQRKLPFSLDDMFKKPTPREISDVTRDWGQRDLSVQEVQIITTDSLTINKKMYTVKIVKHKVQDQYHIGAVLIPKGFLSKTYPIIIEARGVDPEYSPKDIENIELPYILDSTLEAIIAVPAFRGNSIVFKKHAYTAEGTPTDAWDGATDDALAFLNVVLEKIPEADRSRIAAFGMSRGGTVAMLMGIRDKRIKAVVNWAGPSGWLDHMGTFGWTLKEQVQWGLWDKWSPGNGWGSASQFIDWYLNPKQMSKTPSLHTIRHKIIASSPLYFLENLSDSHHHYGKEDRYVSYSNAIAIKHAIRSGNEVFIHGNGGHDQPYPVAYTLSKKFLGNKLKK